MIVTFYSFKGGVGRSMALVNVAEILADRGYRVVVCDWDLEAPGLERYFTAREDPGAPWQSTLDRLTATPGLMDLISEYRDSLSLPVSDEMTGDDYATVGDINVRRPASVTVPVSDRNEESPGRPRRTGSVRLLTVGRRDGAYQQSYAELVRSFDWDEFYTRWAGGSYIEFLRRDLDGDEDAPGAAEIVLLDSRTGVTEHGGICTHHLADLVLLLTAANDANVAGTSWMAKALTEQRLVALREGRPIEVLPVAARIEQTSQKDEVVQFRIRFVDQFSRYVVKASGMDLGGAEFEFAAEIPYMPYYSFEERVCAREPVSKREQQLYNAYAALTDAIVNNGVARGLLPLKNETGQRLLPRRRAQSLQQPFALFLSVGNPESDLGRAIVKGLALSGFSVMLRGDKTAGDLSRAGRALIVFEKGPLSPAQQAEIAEALRQQALRHDFRVIPLVQEGSPPPSALQPIIIPKQPAGPFFAALAAEVLAPDGTRIHYEGNQAYLGSEAFDERTAALFFGRSAEMTEALRWADSGNRWLDIKGCSGMGKTSFINGALIPAIRRGQIRGILEDVHVIGLRTEADSTALSDIGPNDRVLVVVDDWDRLWNKPSEQTKVIQSVIARRLLLPNFYLITTHRSGDPPQFDEITIRPYSMTLRGLTRTDAREALAGPAAVAGCFWERGLMERVLDDLAPGTCTTVDGEPSLIDPSLLAVVAAALGGASGTRISHDQYDSQGGAEGMLLAVAERELQGKDRSGRDLMMWLAAASRNRLSSDDARAIVADGDVMERLAEERLIAIGDFVELRHPLLAGSPALQERNRTERQTVAAIEAGRAARSVSEITDGAVLPSGSLLQFMRRRVGPDSELRALLGIAASRERRIRFRLLAIVLSALFVGAAAREGYYRLDQLKAQIAEANDFAARSRAALAKDPVRALALAIEAGNRAETPKSNNALVEAIIRSRLRAVLKNAVAISRATLSKNTLMTADYNGYVRVWDISSGKQTAASPPSFSTEISLGANSAVAFDRLRATITWWNPTAPDRWQPLASFDAAGRIPRFELSPNGVDLLVINRQVSLWNRPVGTFRRLSAAVNVQQGWFSPTGDTVLISTVDGALKGFRVNSDQSSLPPTIMAHPGGVKSLTFSSDGARVVTTGVKDHTARQWRIDRNATLVPLPWMLLSKTDLVALGYGNADSMFAFGKDDGAHVWPTSSPSGGRIITTSFSPNVTAFDRNSPTLAIGGENGSVVVLRLSPAGDVKTSYPLLGQTGSITSILFTEDSRRIVTTSLNGTAFVWSAEDAAIPKDFSELLALAKNSLPVTLTGEELRQLTQ
jgi:hypothetical protein